MQTFTPPYLVGNPNRPVISQLSADAWGYGEVYNVSVGWTQTTAYIDMAVLIKSGGVTHSVHFDQRMVGPLCQAMLLTEQPATWPQCLHSAC